MSLCDNGDGQNGRSNDVAMRNLSMRSAEFANKIPIRVAHFAINRVVNDIAH